MKQKGMEHIKLDVMVEGGARFYCTLTYEHNPLFRLRAKELEAFVLRKRPTLKYREFQIHFSL